MRSVRFIWFVSRISLVRFKQMHKTFPHEQAGPGDFFSILLKHEFKAEGPQMDKGMICPVNGGIEIAGNRT